MRLYIVIVLLLVFFGCGCAETQKTDSLLDYSKSAKLMFEEAMEEFDDEDCIEAEEIFQDVRRQFPYSKYAPLSEVRLADCAFIQGKHAEAAVSYQHFLKAHPTHEEANYAAYKKGMSYYEMIPSDWIITPPPHERDQAATRDARAALIYFLRTYPSSEWKEKAEETLEEVVDALVRHEMYVARFYLSRNERKAASVRLEGIWVHFPDSSLVPDAMFLQAETFLKMGSDSEAKRVFKEIIERYPEHNQAKRAKDYLDHLAGKTVDESGDEDG